MVIAHKGHPTIETCMHHQLIGNVNYNAKHPSIFIHFLSFTVSTFGVTVLNSRKNKEINL